MQWQQTSTGLYYLLLNMQLCEALQCFGEVNEYDVKKGLRGRVLFFTLDQFQVTEFTEKIAYSIRTAKICHSG